VVKKQIAMEIGKVIKRIRIQRGLSQSELAKLCDLRQTSLSQIESGITNPHESTLDIISEKLGVPKPVFYLLSLKEADVPPEKKDEFHTVFPIIELLFNRLYDNKKEPSDGQVSALLSNFVIRS